MEAPAPSGTSNVIVANQDSTVRLFSYVVARDYGFAPNPFFEICTLATCKPNIRRVASIGDWVIGTGSKKNKKNGSLVYAMRITETVTFNEYWHDERFAKKKPNLRGSKKLAFGDNIYFKGLMDKWHQVDSHHSFRGGIPNIDNIINDTQTDRVLISEDYSYWGGEGPLIPDHLRNYEGVDICAGRNHKSLFPTLLIDAFITWHRSMGARRYNGHPIDWTKTP